MGASFAFTKLSTIREISLSNKAKPHKLEKIHSRHPRTVKRAESNPSNAGALPERDEFRPPSFREVAETGTLRGQGQRLHQIRARKPLRRADHHHSRGLFPGLRHSNPAAVSAFAGRRPAGGSEKIRAG
jgi:hypothetical protein